jgi:hypothetical protein
MKIRILFTATAFLSVLLSGCGADEKSPQEREPKRVLNEAKDFGSKDKERPVLKLAAPEPKLRPVASVGSCAPKSENQLALGSCCNNNSCSGQCVAGERAGQVDCSCFGKTGGCAEGTVCCAATHKCEKAENCYVP